MTYASIAEILQQKYNLAIHRSAICKFINIRKQGGRKVFYFCRELAEKKSALVQPAIQHIHTGINPRTVKPSSNQQPPKPMFEFPYSEKYNLHRLPPEEAAAWQKRLEKEGY